MGDRRSSTNSDRQREEYSVCVSASACLSYVSRAKEIEVGEGEGGVENRKDMRKRKEKFLTTITITKDIYNVTFKAIIFARY